MGKESEVFLYNQILFSPEKMNILSFVTVWMGPADIIQSAVSQMEKDIYCMI